MSYSRIKSFAKINLALYVTGKNSKLHKIESIVGFVSLYDVILIKKIKSKKHTISFYGKYSKNIYKKNTTREILENVTNDIYDILLKNKIRSQKRKKRFKAKSLNNL